MLRALFSGTSGLLGHQLRLDVVGNNIANVNTTGYKGSRSSFEETILQTLRGASAPVADRGGVNPRQVGLGARTASIDSNFNQGNIETTGRRGDLGIEGNGLFVVAKGDRNLYTRNGAFEVDADGYLVALNNGYRVQGFMADSLGAIDLAQPLTDLIIPIGGMTISRTTSQVQYLGNLDAEAIGYAETNPDTGVARPGAHPASTFDIQVGAAAPVSVAVPATVAGGAYTSAAAVFDPTPFAAGGAFSFQVTDSTGTVTSADITALPVNPTAADFVAAWNLVFGVVPPGGPPAPGVRAVLENPTTGTIRFYDALQGGAASQFIIASDAAGGNPTTSAHVTALGLQDGIAVTYGASLTPDAELNALVMADAVNNTAGLTIAAQTNGTGGIQLIQSAPGAAGNFTLADTGGSTLIGDYFGSSPTVGQVDTWRSSVVVYDSLGITHSINVDFARNGNTRQWVWTASDEAGTGIGTGTLTFDDNGQPLTPSGAVDLVLANGAATPQTITLDFTNIQQFGGNSTVSVANQDGIGPGTLETFSVSQDGTIVGEFSNGLAQNLGMVALATFNNNGGLARVGATLFQQTVNSGTAQIGPPDSAQRGTVLGGALEASNVDLADEFIKMITAERGFQANSRIITTADEILQELVNLKR